jgi:hypothetical protein
MPENTTKALSKYSRYPYWVSNPLRFKYNCRDLPLCQLVRWLRLDISTVAQQFMRFPVFYRPRSFSILLTRASCWCQCSASWIQSYNLINDNLGGLYWVFNTRTISAWSEWGKSWILQVWRLDLWQGFYPGMSCQRDCVVREPVPYARTATTKFIW